MLAYETKINNISDKEETMTREHGVTLAKKQCRLNIKKNSF